MLKTISAAVFSAVVIALTPGGAHAAWTCTAKGLVSATYDGGTSAYVHLEGFNRGNSYAVTKNGKVATGTTKNGTKFTCRQK